jgi:hypothetical protein
MNDFKNKPKPDTLINSGALCLAINVLRMAGKNEVADELESSAVRLSEIPTSEIHYYRVLAEKDLEIKMLQESYKAANKMTISYMKEFQNRGVVYAPLINDIEQN